MRVAVVLAGLWFAAGSLVGRAAEPASRPSVQVEAARILVGSKPAKLWGLRVASAACRDEYTQQLIENLAFYREHGINTLVVYYQGSSGQVLRTFASDGRSFADDGVRGRMKRIIEAAAQRKMLVVVGLFVPRKMGADSEDPRLESRQAYLDATRLAAEELKGYSNVILSIAHDAGRVPWTAAPIKMTPEDALDCLKAAAEAAPSLPRGCGGPEHALNQAVAQSPLASVILHTEGGPAPVKFDAAKPVINLGLFGIEAGGRTAQGVWTPREQDRFVEAIGRHASSDADHLCAHFQGWCEGGMDLRKNRFDAGGMGTARDPGLRWYLVALDKRLHPPTIVEPGVSPTTGKSIFDF